MASYWAYTSTGTNYWIYLIVENVDQDTANNRSKVRYKAYLEGASSTSSWGTGSYTVTINGASTSGSIQYDFSSAKKWYCIGSDSGYRTSGYISHNNDGTKSITVSFNFSGASLVGSATISETFTLNTIPRASDVAVSNYTVANTTGSLSATITSRANFYHRWRWKVGSGSWSGWNNKGLIATTSSTVTVSNSNLLSRMPNDKSATFTIEVATYSDSNYSTYVGTKSASATLTVTIKPSVSLGNIAINTSPISGYAVAGYSTVKATWSATAGSGANNGTTYFTISAGSVTASSSTASSGTVTSTTVPGSASNYTLTITAYTVDSRGLRSDNVSKSITVYGYQPPTATLSAYRVADSTSTTEDGAGVYVYVTFSGAVRSTVNSQNSIQSTTCTYSGSISGTATNGQHIALADSQSATFTLTVRDKVTSSTAIVSVAPALYPLDLYDNGQGTVGVGFGTTAESGKVTSALPVFTNGSGWNARFGAIDTQHHGELDLAFNTDHKDHGIYSYGYSTDGSTWTNSGKWIIHRGPSGGVGINGNTLLLANNGNATFSGNINASGNIRTEGFASFGTNAYIDGGSIYVGTSTLSSGSANIVCRSIAGDIYFRCGTTATDVKDIWTKSNGGAYKCIMRVDQSNNATFNGILGDSIATVTATLVSSANFTTLNYPSGFTVSNSVIINWAINTGTASNPAWATGHGLASGSDRTFVQQNNSNILFYNNQSAYYGKQVRVVLMKIG